MCDCNYPLVALVLHFYAPRTKCNNNPYYLNAYCSVDGWPIAKGSFLPAFVSNNKSAQKNSCSVQYSISFTCKIVMLTNFSHDFNVNGEYREIITRVDESFVSVLLLLITLFATATKMKTYNFVNSLKELIKFNYSISDNNFFLKVCV